MWVLLGNSAPPRVTKGDLPPLVLRLTNFLGYLFLILINVLSSTGALGGNNADVSARFPTPLTPSGWAFAIWGLIFALEGLGVIYQIMNTGYREGGWKASIVLRIGYGWQAGWLFQDLWQFAFVRESVPGMWVACLMLLAALAAFQITLHRFNGTTLELRARGFAAMPVLAYAFYKLPTAVNAAWLSVATALGTLIIPVSYGVSQARLVAPAAVLAVVVTAGGVWRLLRHSDVAYGATLIWALLAVASNGSGNVPHAVKVVGIVCLVVLAVCMISALVRTHRERSSAASNAEAATTASGSLLSDPYSSSYGLYGDQRMLLSDSDAPAGIRRASSGSFSFPMLHDSSVVVVNGEIGTNSSATGISAHPPRPSSDDVTGAVALGVGDGGSCSSSKGRPLAPAQPPPGLRAAGSAGIGFETSSGGDGYARLTANGSGGLAVGGPRRSLQDFTAAREGSEPPSGGQLGRRVRFQDEETASNER